MEAISSGFFTSHCGYYSLAAILIIVAIGYMGSPMFVWALSILFMMFGYGAPTAAIITVGVIAAIFAIPAIRRMIITPPVMKLMKDFVPKISQTERTALEAGVVWVESDLFSGKPDFKKMLAEPYPNLTDEEKAFMEGPVEKLCAMIDAWKIWKERDIEQQIWEFIKKERFFGMIIPKEYGGLAFSAMAHSEVIQKIASRSVPACVTVMVPNSLGPAELLAHYGTDEQKKHYLPRLADGREIPCFGLTEPGAGSDAGSITSSGVVFKGQDGKLYMKLNWNKRWITLASVATVIGLAFKLRDPEKLIGKGEDLGITCALIPSTTPGVVIGRQHDPLGVPFYNCPTQGQDVVVPIDAIVGGVKGAGEGWHMLMDCLAAGRGISLPAQSVGGAKLATRVCSAHGMVRQQFGMSIGTFEGVEEPLARIFGFTYGLEAMRKFTLGALDKGIKPPVITAMSKYYSTELGRTIVNDAMDIMGGTGISFGPKNLIGQMYVATPIGITVEGANILTRTLMIFGQGALRAHPYAFKEVNSIDNNDLKGFDEAFWGHIGHVVRNTFRSVVLSVTRARFTCAPVHPELKVYVRRLTWASASFAILADLAMGTLGGTLKARQKITGRFADILAWMYIATATLRRFEAEGRRPADLAFAKYVLKYSLSQIQRSFDGIFDNIFGVKQNSLFGKLFFGSMHFFFKEILGLWSRLNSIGSQANDHLQQVIVREVLKGGETRKNLTEGIFIPKDQKEHFAQLELAMELALQSQVIEKKVSKAKRDKVLPKLKGAPLMEAARDKGVITADEFATVKKAIDARWNAIQVDDFSKEQFVANKVI